MSDGASPPTRTSDSSIVNALCLLVQCYHRVGSDLVCSDFFVLCLPVRPSIRPSSVHPGVRGWRLAREKGRVASVAVAMRLLAHISHIRKQGAQPLSR